MTVTTATRALTLPRADILRLFADTHRVVEKRNTIPILSNALLRLTADGVVEVEATDLDIVACARVRLADHQPGLAGGGEEWAITIPAHLTHDIVRKLPDAPVTLEFAPDAGGANSEQMTVRAGRSRFRVQTLPASDWPNISAGELSHGFTLSGQALAALIDAVDFAVSTEETRYYLNGIYLHLDTTDGASQIVAVATDGHRLGRIRIPAPEGVTTGMPSVIVPRKALAEIGRMARTAGGETIQVELSTSKMRVTGPSGTLTTKLIDGTFPDYRRVIPTGNTRTVLLDREATIAAVDRVATIGSERGRAVRIGIADDQMTLTVINPDAGQSQEEMRVEHDPGDGNGAEITIGFNARYLMDSLSHLPGEMVTLRLGDPNGPAIFEPATQQPDANRLSVLMPVRV